MCVIKFDDSTTVEVSASISVDSPNSASLRFASRQVETTTRRVLIRRVHGLPKIDIFIGFGKLFQNLFPKLNILVEDAVILVRQVDTLMFGKYEMRMQIHLFTDSEGMLNPIASMKQVERKSLRTVIQNFKERLIDEEIVSHQ